MTQTFAVDGVEVRVEGEGAETLLLLHGWPDTLHLWEGTVAHLKDKFRCARFTWPGFAPDSGRTRMTLDEITGLVLKVVDHLCPGGKVTLVLHDWGCIFGYQFAMRHPERVARIVGVDIGDTHSLQRVLGVREKLGIVYYQWWLALAWRIGGGLGDGMTRRMARMIGSRLDPAQIRWQMNWPYYVTWFGGKDALRRHAVPFKPECPMLFVYGRRKLVRFHSPDWAHALAQRPGNRVEGFDTGHWVMLQAPQRFHEIVRGWLLGAPT